MSPTPYGLRVVGHRAGERRLVEWRAAFAAYCACDPRATIDRESYLSHFTFGADFRRLLETERSERGYIGPCGADWVYWDIDRPGDLGAALSDSGRLGASLLDRYRELDEDDVLIFLSGGKGFHIGIPCSLWNPEPSVEFHATAKRFALAAAERAGGIDVDSLVYSKTRLFRAPNSRHPSTGLHKRRLSFEQLMHLKPEAVVALAEHPEPFDLPSPRASSPTAAADWLDATRVVERRTVERRALARDGGPKLSAHARRFLRDGELEGDQRAVSTFRAAAELAELYLAQGIEPMVHALLEEAALDSGLSPSEVRRQITSGIEHARRQREGGAGS